VFRPWKTKLDAVYISKKNRVIVLKEKQANWPKIDETHVVLARSKVVNKMKYMSSKS